MSAKSFFLSLFFLMPCLFFLGCQSEKPNQDQSNQNKPNQTKPFKAPSSFSQIHEDFTAGKIDYDTATLYKTYSLFKHPDLPKKYKSDLRTRRGTTHLKELRRNWNKLSKETQDKLKPFMMNPVQKGSYYRRKDNVSQTSFIRQAYADDPSLPDDFSSLFHHDAANGKVKIWWREGESQQALWLIEAFDTHNIYEKETSFMGRHPKSDMGTVGTDARLDILLEDIVDDGLCYPGDVVNDKTYSYIFIDKKMSKEKIQSAVAHELFHSIQFNIDVNEADWWQEQTATWAEDYIYRNYNIEQNCLPDYFKNFKMRHSLIFEDGEFEYGAYVWPLYLSQKHGPSIIKKIWDACESMAALTAFVQKIPGGVDKAFKEFSLWVYNIEPERKFRDIGGGFLPIAPSIAKHKISVDGVIIPIIDLPLLSLTMEKLYLTPQTKEQIRSIDFNFADFHAEKPKVAVWAIIKIVDKDEVVEDWSKVNIRNYCFDLPDEDLESIVFVLANTNPTASADEANMIDYTAKEYGCEAKLTLNWKAQGGGKGDWEHVYKGGPGKASMGAELKSNESGELSVSFLEHIVDPSDATDPDSGKQLVPFGGFSVNAGYSSKGHWAPLQSHKLTGGSSLTCSGSDTWDGKERSQREYGLLRLNIEKPEPENNTQLSQEDLNMIPPEMQQQLAQMQAMAESMQNQYNSLPGMPSPLQPNERRYKIFLSFGNLPATFSSNIGSSGETEQTTYTPQTLDLKGVFTVDQTTIPIRQRTSSEFGSARVSGTLRIKRQTN
ncbi:MAG: hypothetical protein GY699_00430 [Desulfobacteraceae bacterium]|nr:hypothetical protein [Desulfobacteraceae bacterium]